MHGAACRQAAGKVQRRKSGARRAARRGYGVGRKGQGQSLRQPVAGHANACLLRRRQRQQERQQLQRGDVGSEQLLVGHRAMVVSVVRVRVRVGMAMGMGMGMGVGLVPCMRRRVGSAQPVENSF